MYQDVRHCAADVICFIVSQLEDKSDPTTCSVAHLYDILGCFSPATLMMKILLQLLWQEKIGWDKVIPPKNIVKDCVKKFPYFLHALFLNISKRHAKLRLLIA